jgi:hypothetical protein
MQEKPDLLRIGLNVGVLLFFLIAIGNLYWQVERMQTDIVDLRQSIITEVKKIAETATQAASNSRRAPAAAEPNRKILDSLKEELTAELSAAKRQAAAAALAAKTEAVKHADQLAEQIGQERQSQHKEVVGELGQIKKTEATTSAKIGDVSNDIVNIKSDVASTRQELQETVSELKRVTGDLGVQSGYIATNAKELKALKLLGERNYFEFHIERTGKPQRVGDVSMILRRPTKRNKYTLEVLAGDKRPRKRKRASIAAVLRFKSAASLRDRSQRSTERLHHRVSLGAQRTNDSRSWAVAATPASYRSLAGSGSAATLGKTD